jgi:hypothetical protein
VQPLNAELPNSVHVLGRVTVVKFIQLDNEPWPSFVNVLPVKSADVIADPLNTFESR